MNKLSERGFTLIELLVVIAIIGTLSSVVLASLNTARGKGRDARRVQEVRQIHTALELYNISNGTYPVLTPITAARCLGTPSACWNSLISGDASLITALQPYMPSIPSDPAPNRGIGDRYIYVDGNVNRSCGAGLVTGKFIVWMPDKITPLTDTDCKGVGFFACCATIGCGPDRYCAYQIDP